ncbi:hypothetical protein SAMN05444374_102134 [Rhodococcoides kroppenstedtii]|uniref:Uncharacterized protein n=1 Tax=Rhodococcoides kroppenstedtii TaxID=293050 RepID=A0A1I0SSR3_9NOCA|nr:hypothetical protein [Rhodococcus kroppenstedtii]SFA41806.1 hypothetical protein SAMN05444374_102134 [Rhodococcus kroppenstedtii]
MLGRGEFSDGGGRGGETLVFVADRGDGPAGDGGGFPGAGESGLLVEGGAVPCCCGCGGVEFVAGEHAHGVGRHVDDDPGVDPAVGGDVASDRRHVGNTGGRVAVSNRREVEVVA